MMITWQVPTMSTDMIRRTPKLEFGPRRPYLQIMFHLRYPLSWKEQGRWGNSAAEVIDCISVQYRFESLQNVNILKYLHRDTDAHQVKHYIYADQ